MAFFEALLMAAAGSVGIGCPPSMDVEKMWSSPNQRWLIVGEDHGTNEEPEAFHCIVYQASAKRVVSVAVEQAATEQSAIDAFIASDGTQPAREKFLKSPIWNAGFKDGRSSQAYLLLFERMRLLYKAGRIKSVIAFQPEGVADAETYERDMARLLINCSSPKSLVIALVGGVHAMKTPVSFGGPTYLPMAGHLPASQTKTLELKGLGGKQWACQSPTDCGSSIVFQEGELPRDGLTFTPGPHASYSAVFGLGKPTSASLPQVPGS